ncbi:MAG: excinuclease ABC subunit A [Omnitrophica bacterium RIFCSPLOWO2_01_FULL_45_24]|nr:MAG: excinuclease ABC subunit A [Omnitrophica bacterium RIFCSPHIGHO2_02_FULL_46_20]OGW94764.1 MAG: excinuclease ABC subunit A [Omnitrophica bacterium RIFCSPLOWO2_01_FULL_45_24]
MQKDSIIIKGAKEHNLKNIDLDIPRDKLIVITGLSGSGKSSLAFDTIYAEGQRRYVESLSSYARQFLEQLQKPDVEYIEGLSPAISIEQRTAGSNPRSTVGTQTEIYDYLRVLFARIGIPHCPKCKKPIRRQTPQEIVKQVMRLPENSKIIILAPLVRGRKGEYNDLFQRAKKDGFVRVRVDGNINELDKPILLDKNKTHAIEVVVDRIVLKNDIRKRLTDSIETAIEIGKGLIVINNGKDILFSERYACIDCGISLGEIEPRIFSFNSPYGACPMCDGLGNKIEIDPELVISDKSKPVISAVDAWRRGGKGLYLYYRRRLRSLGYAHGFDVETPFKDLPKDIKKLVLYGETGSFEGVIPNLERRFRETESEFIKTEINKYMSVQPCHGCEGMRLKAESLAVTIQDKNISEVSSFSIKDIKKFLTELKITETEKIIAHQVLKEVNARLQFTINVGLDYLTLDRRSFTLSGGEAQRIRLATQIGSGLVGVVYILDEPSIGLHQKDNSKLLDTLIILKDLGNTLIVVEHDEMTIRKADHIIDLGPGAGEHGGQVIVSGTLKDVLDSRESLTGKYLRGELKISIPDERKPYLKAKKLKIIGASEHNLKSIDVEIPLGLFVCVTGVSGSGKSTLIDEILYRALAKKFYKSKEKPGAYKKIEGIDFIDKVIVIDQSPIGRTPRSNPATYTAAFAPIRDLFSRLPDSKVRGYKPGRFSFNVKGGRCEACMGDGIKRIEMHFLPDIYVQCEVCKGKRFSEQTLDVRYKGRSIADILDMSVEKALELFVNIPVVRNKLKTLYDVGLGYIKLGQSATTLSGGEAQRIKLATELSKTSTGKTFYILDEPTTGLHFADIDQLLNVLHALVNQGNTVLVIEHNLDVIKTADYIIDLGPEGGDEGGEIVANGTPEEIVNNKKSYTGRYLKQALK